MDTGTGLIDFLTSPESSLGLNLLAAGGPSTDPNMGFGARLAGAVDRTKQAQLERDAKNQALWTARQKGALLNLGIQGLGGAPITEPGASAPPGSPGSVLGAAPSQAQGTAAGAGAAPVGSPGAVLGDSGGGAVAQPVAPQSSPAGMPLPAGPAAPAGNPARLLNAATALKLGGMADILPNVQAGLPKLEIHDGVLWDMNPITNPTGQPRGFVRSKSTSADGKSVINLEDGSTIAAPGAVATFGAFEDAKNRSQAQNTESRQTVIGPSGREVSQSVYDAINGRTPPAAGGAAAAPAGGGAAPAPRPMIGPGAGYASPGGLAGGTTSSAADMQREVLSGELVKAQQGFAQAQAAGDAPGAARYQQDIASVQRELARLPGARGAAPVAPAMPAPVAGGLPPPSPIVAQSGGGAPGAAPATPLIGPGVGVRTDFTQTPGQGIGIGGGNKFNSAEQAAQAAAKQGAERQAALTAEAEANPNKFLADTYAKASADAKGAPNRIANLEKMLEISQRRGASTLPVPGALIGMVPSNISQDLDAYNKARAQYMDNSNAPTDAARSNLDVAVPQYGVKQSAQEGAIRQQLGVERAKAITEQILAPYTTQGAAGGAPGTAANSVLMRNLTPEAANLVYPVLTMPKGPERTAAFAAARANPQAAEVMRQAIASGVLKP